ncbi:MAG: hypothetical protein WBC44_03780 [Planctomycetaceae bacterium]
MSDPLRKPVNGEPFVPSVRQFGAFIDTVRRVDELTRNQQHRRGDAYDPTRIQVKNETGGDLTGLRPIVALGDPVLDPSDAEAEARALERPVLRGASPIAGSGEPFAVLQGPLRAANIAPAVVSGVTWVRLDVDEDDDRRFAEPDDATRLRLAESGPAEVLWREGGDGEQWALIRLTVDGGRVEGLLITALPKPSCALAVPTSGLMRVYERDPLTHALEATTRTIELRNSDPDLSGEAGFYAKAERMNGVWSVYWLGCTDATEGCASSNSGSSGSGEIR